MGKKQKNALLDDALCELIDAHQERSGATFARICTAALIEYLFSYGKTPDPFWMRMALALEKGKASVRDIAKDAAMHGMANVVLPAAAVVEHRQLVAQLFEDYHGEVAEWYRSTDQKDPVASVIEWWEREANRQKPPVDKGGD